MDAFAALDQNHDGVLSRAEFYGGLGGGVVQEPVAGAPQVYAAAPTVTYGAPRTVSYAAPAAVAASTLPATTVTAAPVYMTPSAAAPQVLSSYTAPAVQAAPLPQVPPTTVVAAPVYMQPTVSQQYALGVPQLVQSGQVMQEPVTYATAQPTVSYTTVSRTVTRAIPRLPAGSAQFVDRCRIYDNITDTVGQTPIVKINKLAPEGVNLYVKLEYFNPLSSVKDRLAKAIIEAGERSGELKPGGTVVEATSGNTGIALAMVCAQRGYQFVSVIAASFSVERRKVMRMLGAKVLVTPAPLGGTGMVKKAEELAEANGWFLARQFETEANAAFHKKTTGPEILAAFRNKGLSLDYWVTGYGTGGTFTGAGQAIKEGSPHTKIILVEPEGAALVTSGVPQERKDVLGKFGAPAAAHPNWKPHPIQGWTPNFIPLVCEQGLQQGLHDEVALVDGKEAMATAIDLARYEGIFTGTSGGATVLAALKLCQTLPPGTNVLAMVADTAERYLSTPLFEGIDAEMNEEEQALFDTTPLGKA